MRWFGVYSCAPAITSEPYPCQHGYLIADSVAARCALSSALLHDRSTLLSVLPRTGSCSGQKRPQTAAAAGAQVPARASHSAAQAPRVPRALTRWPAVAAHAATRPAVVRVHLAPQAPLHAPGQVT